MQTENWSRSVDFIVFMNRGTRKMRKHALVIYGLVTATLWLTGKRPDFLPGRPS